MNKIYYIFILLVFLLYFYRKPSQNILLQNTDIVYSPAYGKIMDIKQRQNDIYIAIFLSPLDVHYQFVPINGKIKSLTYDYNGQFNLAYDLNKSKENEKTIYQLENDKGIFTIYQIAGFFVRRIKPIAQVNQLVKTGDTLGLIHFGSRVDIIIPKNNFKLMVKVGDYVKGTYSILGKYLS